MCPLADWLPASRAELKDSAALSFGYRKGDAGSVSYTHLGADAVHEHAVFVILAFAHLIRPGKLGNENLQQPQGFQIEQAALLRRHFLGNIVGGIREQDFCELGGDALPGPVSYTHLDVYKRQDDPPRKLF